MNAHRRWFGIMALTLALVVAAVGCKTAPEEDESIEPTGPFAEIQRLVPKSAEVAPWKRTGRMEIYLGQLSLSEPPVGVDVTKSRKFAESPWAVEAPLAAEYKHRVSLSREFAMKSEAGQPEKLVLIIHEMNDPDEAFGIASVAGAGEPLAGPWVAGKKTANGLSFAKGRCYVKVERVTPGVSQDALMAVANNAANKILAGTTLPTLAAKLPAANLVPGSLVYMHGPEGLRRADALLGAKAEPVLKLILGDAKLAMATYRTAGGGNTVFLIDRYVMTQVPSVEILDNYLATASPEERNRVTYTMVGNRYVVGTLNAEEESVQRVMPKIISAVGG